MKKKLFSKKFILLILILAAVGYYFVNKNLLNQTSTPNNVSIDSSDQWWNNDYTYRREISIDSSTTQTAQINHAQMVIDGKSNADGSDLKVIAQDGATMSEVSFDLSKPNDLDTKLQFEKLADSNLKYYLYYGDKNPTVSNVLGTNSNISESTNSSVGSEETPTISFTSLKNWVLKENDTTQISFRVQSDKNLNGSQIYAIFNNNESKKIPASYQSGLIKISADDIQTGADKLYIVVNVDGQIYRSNTASFNYSYPLYVAWTIDWEGTVPNYQYLDQMEQISTNYNVPMTHYFNPRIYINVNTTDAQRKYLSDWVTRRVQEGDDIGMHLHMQTDMVEEAGVTPVYNDTWDNGTSGYDTPSTAYDYSDYLKMLTWGKNELQTQLKKFSNFDVPTLQGFRAGGWFANEGNLKAIQDAGFIYDTTGRVPFPIGANMLTQPWTLKTTSQPYYISTTNQSTNTAPTLNLKELPDNGADSYWSTGPELIANFYQNYSPGEVLNTDKLVVFLSHPDWFYIDDSKLQSLYAEINKYRNDYDLGPVKFVTMREYLADSPYIKAIDAEHAN